MCILYYIIPIQKDSVSDMMTNLAADLANLTSSSSSTTTYNNNTNNTNTNTVINNNVTSMPPSPAKKSSTSSSSSSFFATSTATSVIDHSHENKAELSGNLAENKAEIYEEESTQHRQSFTATLTSCEENDTKGHNSDHSPNTLKIQTIKTATINIEKNETKVTPHRDSNRQPMPVVPYPPLYTKNKVCIVYNSLYTCATYVILFIYYYNYISYAYTSYIHVGGHACTEQYTTSRSGDRLGLLLEGPDRIQVR